MYVRKIFTFIIEKNHEIFCNSFLMEESSLVPGNDVIYLLNFTNPVCIMGAYIVNDS